MERTEIISFESLVIGFRNGSQKKPILPPLSARAYSGEFIALIGRNGIGKSTLLRTLIKLQVPLAGSLLLKETPITEVSNSDLARMAGYISTEPVRAFNMTVYDLVCLGRFPHTNWIGAMKQSDIEAVESALLKTGMFEFAGRYVAELSDGERQRAMIARLLAQEAQLMIMDEPTAFLDIPAKLEIMGLLRNLTREGRTIIFSTHDLATALRMTDRIWLLLKENLVEGSPAEMLKDGSFGRLFGSAEIAAQGSEGIKNYNDYLKYFL